MEKKTEKSCLWKQSPLLAPHRKWRFARLHAVCQTKMGYVNQDTWHVWKPIFWYMHLYHALLSKRTCGYYLCFFFWFPLFLKCFIIHPPPVTRGKVLPRVKHRAKNGVSKRAGKRWGRKEGNLPLLPLSFFRSWFISRAAKTENPVLRSFFAPKPNGNACCTG